MIEIIPNFPDNVVAFTARGKVTSEDYESVLIPEVESKLEKHDKLRLLYHFDEDFSGFGAGAMWDDARVGLRHLTKWEKIAVVSDAKWLRRSTKFFGFMMPGKVEVYKNDRFAEAKEWVVE